MPPIMIVAAAPDGALCAADQRLIFLKKTRTVPPCPGGALRRGALVKSMMAFPIFMVPV
jgi:hypothetical protein